MGSVLITGATSGLAWRRQVHRRTGAADIVIAGRSPDRMREMAAELRDGDGVRVSLLPMDVSSMASVSEGAAAFGRMVDHGETAPLSVLMLVASIAYDLGYVPETRLVRTAPAAMQWFSRTTFFKLLFRLFGGTPGNLAFSGAGLGRVAVDAEYAGASGRFIQSKNLKLSEARSSTASYDVASAKALWRDSADLVGLTGSETPRAIDLERSDQS